MLKRISGGQRSVVVVEHDMEFVRALDCKVTALHEGSVLAEGTLDTVSAMRPSSKCIWGADMLKVEKSIFITVPVRC